MANEYRPLALSDLEPMAQVLAQSFEEDPLVSFILPNPRTRVKTVAKFFRAMGRLNIRANSAFGMVNHWQVWRYGVSRPNRKPPPLPKTC